jgi:Zn-finger nucleic acid-binding protein
VCGHHTLSRKHVVRAHYERFTPYVSSLVCVICPKCQNVMQTVDRNGIHIEQCQGCRGIFLDRGELEQMAGAEQRYHQQMAPPAMYRGDSAPPYRGGHSGGHHNDSAPPYGYGRGRGDSPPPYGRGHGDSPPPYGHGGHKRKRRSFLEDLFD